MQVESDVRRDGTTSTEPPPRPGSPPSCAILVLNWNGRSHLEILLPSLQLAVAGHTGRASLVVVDNRSTQPDVEFVRRQFPAIEVVVAERNDYLFSLNKVIAGREEDIVIVLNNDMRVEADFIGPLLEHFADPAVFAVAALVREWDGSAPQIGQRLLAPERFWVGVPMNLSLSGPAYTAEAGGGCAAFRRAYFLELNGFDRLYWPAYVEDLDLTYRAWKRGWRSIVEPRSVIYHRGGATLFDRADGLINNVRERRMRRLVQRNLSIFMLANVDGWQFVLGFLAMLPWRIAYNAVKRRNAVAGGLLASIRFIPSAFLRRWKRRGRTAPRVAEIAAAVREPVQHPARAEAA